MRLESSGIYLILAQKYTHKEIAKRNALISLGMSFSKCFGQRETRECLKMMRSGPVQQVSCEAVSHKFLLATHVQSYQIPIFGNTNEESIQKTCSQQVSYESVSYKFIIDFLHLICAQFLIFYRSLPRINFKFFKFKTDNNDNIIKYLR